MPPVTSGYSPIRLRQGQDCNMPRNKPDRFVSLLSMLPPHPPSVAPAEPVPRSGKTSRLRFDYPRADLPELYIYIAHPGKPRNSAPWPQTREPDWTRVVGTLK